MQVHNISTAVAATNYYEAPRDVLAHSPTSIERVRADSVHATRLLTEHYMQRIWNVEAERNQLQAERDQVQALRQEEAGAAIQQCNELSAQLENERQESAQEMRRLERERTVLEDACQRLREQAAAWRRERQALRQELMGMKRDHAELKALNHGLIRETERLTQDRTRVADKYWDKYIGIKADVQRRDQDADSDGSESSLSSMSDGSED